MRAENRGPMTEGRTTDENGPAAQEGEDTEACSHEEGNTPGEPQPVAFRSRSSGGRRSGLGRGLPVESQDMTPSDWLSSGF